MDSVPETRYAEAEGGGQIAYQVTGSGSALMLGISGLATIEVMWEEPRFARFLDRLSTFSRHVWFDARGAGASGSFRSDQGRVIERAVDDMVAVLDAIGEERAILLGLTPPPALLFAASHPDRTAGLVLLDASARFRRDDQYPGLEDDEVERILTAIEREWGTGVFSRQNGWAAPDDRAQRWYAKTERVMFTPREAAEFFRFVYDIDLRAVLPTISAPTLVVARPRSDDRAMSQTRFVADHITGAKYVEVPRGGHLMAALDPIEEFVTGRLPVVPVDRVLATVLFTDIVGSTAWAAELGDHAWRRRLDEHDALVRRQLVRFRGREVKTMGDGFLATFDAPARAIRCARALRDEATQLGIETRAGLHAGEIELRGDDITGMTVNIAARVAALADIGEILVSRTVTDLVAGSGLGFEARGEHELKGVPGQWQLFALSGEVPS